jgi:hypothetical protein
VASLFHPGGKNVSKSSAGTHFEMTVLYLW